MSEDYQNTRDKLDYAQIVFRQIDRINMLMCNTQVARVRTTAIEEVYSALYSLESLFIYRISEKNKKQYIQEKEKLNLKIGSLDGFGRAPKYQDNFKWFNLQMKFINESNLLPAQRTSYKTGDD